MRTWLKTAVTVLCVCAGSAQADRLVVVELFTSQGCSSCPPADALLGELSSRDDILPLAFHVDYWDYIGWKDEFADPSNTDRQRGYARAAGDRTIYTPQMIVGGEDHVIGYKPMKLAEAIERHADLPGSVDVTATLEGTTLRVVAEPVSQTTGVYEIKLVSYEPEATVAIKRGENAGRTLTYHNIVSRLVDLGLWDGEGRRALSAELPDGGTHAVIVQRGNHGPIVAAARVR